MLKINYVEYETLKNLGESTTSFIPKVGEKFFFMFEGNNQHLYEVMEIEYLNYPLKDPDGENIRTPKGIINWVNIGVTVFLSKNKESSNGSIPYEVEK